MRKGREIESHCRLSPQHSAAVWRTCRSSHSRQNEPVLKGFFWQGSAKGLICLASNFTSRDRQTGHYSPPLPLLCPLFFIMSMEASMFVRVYAPSKKQAHSLSLYFWDFNEAPFRQNVLSFWSSKCRWGASFLPFFPPPP